MAFARMLTGERYTGSHAQFKADHYKYCSRLLELSESMRGEDVKDFQQGTTGGSVSNFVDHAWYFCNRRKLVHTESGYYDFAPLSTKQGDVCAIIFGCKVPLILRAIGQTGVYKLVGEAYI
ncbi:hypothetical protein BU26DRAFT_557673 [Trematosphaeria pertusa]|uniref:Uncharacterized protein n=1 Tax=Trematosphaeria pertusa TaxID=390896 RepID=A0A6A6J0H6_9PLEO|nr:uncharacterized protein BU26DRAFT_557673 [Trematosphaeria pertusa]KAF2256199.1 hypothetical protein BU26DRAFT_557673 [Trematosphaeria pertusa]